MTSAVRVNTINYSYQEALIIENGSFEVKEKDFTGIIGPNGGGKTTLLKLIMGILVPQSGKIQVFGKPPKSVRKKIAYVPQVLSYDRQFPISVGELVLAGRLSHLPWYGIYKKRDKEKADEILEKLRLQDLKQRSFGTLSGGQAQRALIARALISEPELLILDEPTSNIDSQAEAEIYSILQELKGEKTILMVTHHLQKAIKHFDRVLCVQQQIISLEPKDVCEHFAFGLYHPPLVSKDA